MEFLEDDHLSQNSLKGLISVYLFFQFQHVPSIVVIVYSILCILGILPIILLVMVLSGTLIGWVYLRFYQPRGKGVKGDLSESFSCASFFPEALQ